MKKLIAIFLISLLINNPSFSASQEVTCQDVIEAADKARGSCKEQVTQMKDLLITEKEYSKLLEEQRNRALKAASEKGSTLEEKVLLISIGAAVAAFLIRGFR